MKLSRSELAIIAALVVVGAALRLSFPSDIEYKADEQYMFDAAMNVGRTEPWPSAGMPSGAGLRNPPMSIWLFVVLARAFFVETPPGLARVVELANVAALVLLVLFALRRLEAPWQRAWLWGVGLASVSPVAVQLQRKIWAQSILPFFSALLFWAWWHRRSVAGAFFWGLLGALVGQIHMSGFLFAPALWLWTLVFDERRREVKWIAWTAGSALGALPLLPWFAAMASGQTGGAGGFRPVEILYFRYPMFWVSEPLGLQMRFSLGPDSFQRFLAFPFGTYGTGLLHVALFAAGLFALYSALVWTRARRAEWRRWLTGRSSEVALLIAAAGLGYWLLQSATTIRLFRHYLLIVYPLSYVMLAYVMLAHAAGRRVLIATACALMLLSASFLAFIHVHAGSPDGDYGTAYRANASRPR